MAQGVHGGWRPFVAQSPVTKEVTVSSRHGIEKKNINQQRGGVIIIILDHVSFFRKKLNNK